jgi:hypothetical protein
MNAKDVRYRQEIIQNMRKVIESNNYVWIVTANSSSNYTRKNFCSKFFGPTDEDFFYKSEYFYFMNPDIIEQQYREAKKEFPSDKKLGDIVNLGWHDIHTLGLKPYGIYAQSLITKKKYNETHTPQIGDFKIYLFDDTNKGGYLAANSLKIGITFIFVTDFTTKVPNLIPEFKKVLDDGISKIGSASAPAPVSASVSTTASSSSAIAPSVIPDYIKTYNELTKTGKPVSNCACNHKICITYNTLLTNNFIRTDTDTTGVHSVTIFKSKKTSC